MLFRKFGKPDNLVTLEVCDSFMEGFHQTERDNLFQRLSVFIVSIIAERFVVFFFLTVPNDNNRETETLKLVRDQHTTNTTIAIAKWMSGFKIQMELRVLPLIT